MSRHQIGIPLQDLGREKITFGLPCSSQEFWRVHRAYWLSAGETPPATKTTHTLKSQLKLLQQEKGERSPLRNTL
jgi:hypothetical protein